MTSLTQTDDRLVYKTTGGIVVSRTAREITYEDATSPLAETLSSHPGVLLSSSYEYPGRYSRWDIGFAHPPIRITGRGRSFTIDALNERGALLLAAVIPSIAGSPWLNDFQVHRDRAIGEISVSNEIFPEEYRSKQHSLFSLLRAILQAFRSDLDGMLGVYGAFGYDLALQFEPLKLKCERNPAHRDLVLYIPDEILAVDHYAHEATLYSYDFEFDSKSSAALPRMTPKDPFRAASSTIVTNREIEAGAYAKLVTDATEYFKRGDLFEVVPCQKFFEVPTASPGELFDRLQKRNPAPYSFIMNLGENEFLVGASPEMFVRVTGKRVETCPIAGTVARGHDAISDAEQILKLLSSKKDLSELTMCTDVDRNDKSRICVPGTIRVLGRRQIEMYSRVIHTVDHVEGELRDDFDSLDAFLSHAWAVTVTGAPKRWAMQFIEDHERSPRRWYGGAVGALSFNGDMNTGLTLRTIHLQNGIATVTAGATLLFDSIPEEEEKETEMKASALLDVIRQKGIPQKKVSISSEIGKGRKVFFVDHEDSFVHTLAGYFRQTGADVITHRHGFDEKILDAASASLLALSPGPGTPREFNLNRSIALAIKRNLPIFGVCLGLQGLVEFFGGSLGRLDLPMHGKPSKVLVKGGKLFAGLPEQFEVGRYHSLFGARSNFPKELIITAETEDGVVMAIEHRDLPIAAVQFHPESIMTLEVGHRIIQNVLSELVKK